MREEKGLSQSELARRIGVSRQALSAIEIGKQDPSLPLALLIGRELNFDLKQLFFLEDDLVPGGKVTSLTKIERLGFVNQYQLLQAAHRDDDYLVRHYQRLEEIFNRGYEALYHEAFDPLWNALPEDVSEQVLDILDLHRTLLGSLGEKPNPKDIERVKFLGFDGNQESQHLAFARFYTSDGDKYKELQVFNSHNPTLERYGRMLAEWKRMNRNARLSKEQIDSILEAGTFRH